MSQQAFAAMIAKLKAELHSIEREPTRNQAERELRDHRAECLRRDIAHVKSGNFRVGV
jgi:hypothetical protein